MGRIKQNLDRINAELGNTTLVAVSKYRSLEELNELYDAGHRVFGENRVPELVDKHSHMSQDIEWHMIGHLQRNKVKYIAPFVSMIHSVDSLRLAKEINKEAKKHNREIPILIQFKLGDEESKFGHDWSKLVTEMEAGEWTALDHLKVSGVMGMATNTDNETVLKNEFSNLTKMFNDLKLAYFSNSKQFKEISMGMSGDYPIAIACGATMVRIGSKIFA